MKVVIAEKPSVGKDLAKVIGAKTIKDGYIEGDGIAFTWAFGHLVQLAYPESYGFKEWSKDNLPMLPEEFQLLPKQKRVGKEYKADPGVLKQLKTIKNLFDKAAEIIVATDAGREGELIFRYIYSYLGCKKPFKRLWISSQTDRAIKDGFSDLKPGNQFNSLYESAKARSEADWLVGLNATQALTLAVGKGLYSVGRVQTPTLAMICERYLHNKNFKPEIYYQLSIDVEKDRVKFTATSPAKYKSQLEADSVLKRVKETKEAIVKNVEVKEKREEPPLLYDLTTLQQDANRKYSFSADKTLEIAQTLYESKFITYPRTDSRYIGDDVFEKVPELIKLLDKHPLFKDTVKRLIDKSLNKRSVNADKVSDHHALLPTDNVPSSLEKNEQLIYDLIAGRMLEAFSDKCLKEITTVELSAVEKFIAKGSVIKQPGWRSVFNDRENEDGEDVKLPALKNDDVLKIIEYRNEQKQTKPKPLYTEGSLLEAMKTCGREIEDEEAREAMKEGGLGTPATRAGIIETLVSREYIERVKKSLIPTEKGLAVYHCIKDKSIGSPVMTGEWEKKLSDIEKGKLSADLFIKGIKGFASQLTSELLQFGSGIKETQGKMESENAIICPKCNDGKVSFIKNSKIDAAICSQARDKCGFIVFREVAKKKLSDQQIVALITQRKTGLIRGFLSKTGNPFEASLVLSEDFKITFDFPSHNAVEGSEQPNSENLIEEKCPKCGGELRNNQSFFACSECDFKLFKIIAKKKLTTPAIKKLLSTGSTDKMKLLNKDGKEFEAKLKFDENYKIVFDFK